MRNQGPSSSRLLPSLAALALVVSSGIAPVHAQTGAPGTTPTTAAEMQRGVPGIDVDLGANGRPATNGVPGVDVDLRSQREAATNGVPGVDVDVDTRLAGAGADGLPATRSPIQDRN